MTQKLTEQFSLYGIAATVVVVFILSQFVELDEVKNIIVASGVFAPPAFIFLKTLTIVIAPISGSPLYPLIGLFFGFWPGLLYVALGDFLGYTIAFFVSRIFGRERVSKYLLNNEKGKMTTLIENMGTAKGFFHACLLGFPLPEVLSYTAGLSRLAYWKFIIILWPASTIVAGALVFFGTTLDALSGTVSYLIPVVGLMCMSVGGFFFLRDLKK